MGGEQILIVDDEGPARHLISAVLTKAGYETKNAASGAEALRYLEEEGEAALLLTDMMMSELDGVGLLERCQEKFPDMPVVFITAVEDTSIATATLRAGAYDYVIKPFQREHLMNVVRRSLDTRRLRVENRIQRNHLEALVAARTQQLNQSLEDLSRSYNSTLELAGDLMGFKDPAREAHARRVTSFAIAIARGMGLAQDHVDVIARGAFLHDIGMIGVPDVILHKPGPLSPEETAQVREHCFHGYRVLRKIPYLREAAEIVYAHEERYDGSGYPRGLKGEEIPLGARIFSVAHALDAITTDWEYRVAQTLEAALSEISSMAGTQFDPHVVRVFLGMKQEIWDALRREIDQARS